MQNTRRCLLVPAIALAMVAQEPQAPTIRVTTRLVEVSVIVRDKNGPVAGLSREDFKLFDEGKPQQIAFFNMNSARRLEKLTAPLAANTFTNRLEQRGETPTSATVVLLDGLNTPIPDQAAAKRQLIRFLSQAKPEDRIAVYLMSSTRLRILSDFTNDSGRLIALLKRYSGEADTFIEGSEHESRETGNAEFDEFLKESDALVRRVSQQRRAEDTCAALEAIANHVRRLPGRKNLLWVTASFPFQIGFIADAGRPIAANLRRPREPRLPSITDAQYNPAADFSAEVRRATRALNDSNMAVYPVDARGLIGPLVGITGQPVYTNTTNDTSRDTMKTIASDTGGRAFYNTNDIQHALRDAVDDSEVAYTLAFYPQNLDGKFHAVKVQVARDGVEVRARRGYLASAGEDRADSDPVARVEAALASPLEASGISITATAGDALALRIDLNDLTLVRQGEQWTGAFDLVSTMRAADGRELFKLSELVQLKYPEARLEAAKQRGVNISRAFMPVPDAAAIRIVVLDRNSSRVGSLQIPLAR